METALSTTVPKSRLREPHVIAMAALGPVEVTTGSHTEALVLLPRREFHARVEVTGLMELFLRIRACVRLADPSPVLFGEAAFLADWPPEDQQRFLDEFAEALAESARLNDPSPARFLLDAYVRAASRPTTTSPAFTGQVSESAAEALAARFAAPA